MTNTIEIAPWVTLNPDTNELKLSNWEIIPVEDASDDAIKWAEEYCRVLEWKNVANQKK